MTDQVKLGSEIIQSVINCISQTNLCSYQIAYKHHISQHSVESIGLKNLGKNIYWNTGATHEILTIICANQSS